MARYLLDTNVLVYGFDEAEPEKQARALDVVARVATGRLRPPLPADGVFRHVGLYERAFPVVALTPAVVLEAVRGLRDHAFSYYDAQIWAAARLNQIPVVLSEDLASGSTVEGVTFVNPFDPAFDTSELCVQTFARLVSRCLSESDKASTEE